MLRFGVLGRTGWLTGAARRCIERGHELAFIGTCAAAPEYDVREEHFAALAREHGVPYFCSGRLGSDPAAGVLADAGADVVISVNWATLIGEPVLSAPRFGVINAHVGDLPRYRGNATLAWALLQGEEHCVASLHRMVPELDAGPVLLQRDVPIEPETYVGDLYAEMGRLVPLMFADALDGLAAGTLHPVEQPGDPAVALRCLPRRPSDGHLDPSLPAEHLARVVRASAEPFEGAFSYVEGRLLRVWRARPERTATGLLGVPGTVVERRPNGDVAVLTGDGLLVLEQVELAGGARCAAGDVLSSVRQRLGLDVHAELHRLLAERPR